VQQAFGRTLYGQAEQPGLGPTTCEMNQAGARNWRASLTELLRPALAFNLRVNTSAIVVYYPRLFSYCLFNTMTDIVSK
jgi:hypothetical protein